MCCRGSVSQPLAGTCGIADTQHKYQLHAVTHIREVIMAQRRTLTVSEYARGRAQSVRQPQGQDLLERQATQEEFRNQGWAMEYSHRRHTLMNEHEWAGFGAEYELHGNGAWGLDLWTMG